MNTCENSSEKKFRSEARSEAEKMWLEKDILKWSWSQKWSWKNRCLKKHFKVKLKWSWKKHAPKKNFKVKWSKGSQEEISRWSKLHFCTPLHPLKRVVSDEHVVCATAIELSDLLLHKRYCLWSSSNNFTTRLSFTRMCEIQRFLNFLSGETELQLMFLCKEQTQTKVLIKGCFFCDGENI